MTLIRSCKKVYRVIRGLEDQVLGNTNTEGSLKGKESAQSLRRQSEKREEN